MTAGLGASLLTQPGGVYALWGYLPKYKKLEFGLRFFCFSLTFNKAAVNFLEEMNVPAYKIASLEITDILLIQYLALKGKPVFISTGIATVVEIEKAVNAFREVGNE